MHTRTIGNDTVGRLEVGAIGLGLMTFDQTGTQSRDQLAQTVQAALDAGVTFFDTADAYGPGDELGAGAQGANEQLIASLLDELGVRDRVVLATKGGHVRTDGGDWATDSSRTHLEQAVDDSLRRLGVDQLTLWQHHRPDPEVPYDDVLDTLAGLAESGKVRMFGLSNADEDQIRAGHKALGDRLVSVQNEFSPGYRSSAGELAHCASLGLAFLPWSPFGGVSVAKTLGSTAAEFTAVAQELGVSVYRVTVAWHLAQADVVLPIPGASRPQSIIDSAAAVDLELPPEQLARLDAA